jgi:MATE family multidrug resistance protein
LFVAMQSAVKPTPEQPNATLWRPLVNLSWPIALSMLSYSVMTAVDSLFVGRVGTEALAAVGLGGVTSFTLLTFSMGTLRAGKLVASHNVGAGHSDQLDDIAAQSVGLALLLAVATLVVTLATAPLLAAAFDEPAAGRQVTWYVATRALGIVPFVLSTALRELAQATGDSRGPMRAAVLANVANVPLNALLVLGLHWGVVGSALANVFAQLVEFIWLARQRRGWLARASAVGRGKLARLFRLGWPLGLEMFLDISSLSVLSLVIARMGALELAAHQIAMQVSHLTLLPLLAVGEGAAILAGYAYGGGRTEQVAGIARAGVGVGLLYAAVMALPLVVAPDLVAACFARSTELCLRAALLLHLVAGFQLAFVFYAVGRAVLRGLGDLRYTVRVTVGVAWLCTPTLGLLLGHGLGWGAIGGWCGLCTEILVASTIYFHRLRSGGWRVAASRVLTAAGGPAAAPGT